MRAATLFSGIGAPEVAMPDWDWIWHAEIEKFPAAAVMATRHPSSVNLGDVTANDFCERALAIGRPDVLVFGSPCQSFSVAGRRLGLDDPRGNLALIALGIVERLRPTWFTFENVPGLFSSWSGGPDGLADVDAGLRDGGTYLREFTESSDFAAFLSAVRDIGYHGAWAVLDAQFTGLAQRRDRVFFVGHLGTAWQRAAAVLLEPESLCGHPPTRGQAREDVAPTLGAGPVSGGRKYGTCADTVEGLVPVATYFQDDMTLKHGPVVGALRREAGGAGACVAFMASDYQTGEYEAVDTARPLTTSADRSRSAPVVAFHENQRAEVTLNDTAGSLKVGGVKPGQGYPAVLSSGVRRLMPVECERLQGFPDHYTQIAYRGKPAKDGPRYKAIGNSMAVPVIRWILERIDWVEKHVPVEKTA